MITFKVSNIEKCIDGKDIFTITSKQAIMDLMEGEFEGVSNSGLVGVDVNINNRFVDTIHKCFSDHYGLVISPDDIWLTISQGFARHINLNFEKYRNRFVDFDGKKEIIVRRDSFIKGGDNDWEGVFKEFSEKVGAYVGKSRELIEGNFSTTGDIEVACSRIVLMDCMSHYFDYTVLTRCGIPEITLLGERGDWESIKERIGVFREFDLGWWVDVVEGIIDNFIMAFDSKVVESFWKGIYKWNNESGGPTVTGWIGCLFPYLVGHDNNVEKNCNFEYGIDKEKDYSISVGTDGFPGSVSSVPFIWDYLDNRIEMRFVGGIIGYRFEFGGLKPVMGWGIGEREKKYQVILQSIKDKWQASFKMGYVFNFSEEEIEKIIEGKLPFILKSDICKAEAEGIQNRLKIGCNIEIKEI